MSQAQPQWIVARSRPRVLLALAAVVALGLASRSGNPRVPAFVAAHAGDALWTVAAHLGLAVLATRSRVRTLAWSAFGLSVLVELSQLSDAPVLVQLRSHALGRLLLGAGWQALDLVRYAAGALLAAGLDVTLLRPQRPA